MANHRNAGNAIGASNGSGRRWSGQNRLFTEGQRPGSLATNWKSAPSPLRMTSPHLGRLSMPPEGRQTDRLLRTIESKWAAFKDSYAGLPDARLLVPGVVDHWSVKDILAHVNTWEEEALRYLPVIVAGGTPPRYFAFGGIDAFNARMAERKRDLPLSDVRRQLDRTHGLLIEFVRSVPGDQLAGETRLRRRLRLDTYGHYDLHAGDIRRWRARLS
jgi:hypothetical protein